MEINFNLSSADWNYRPLWPLFFIFENKRPGPRVGYGKVGEAARILCFQLLGQFRQVV
jgi:hypothetical protein